MHLKENRHGFDDPIRYLFRSTGGIIALSDQHQLRHCDSAHRCRETLQRSNRPLPAFLSPQRLLGILLAGFSGMSFLGNRANLGDVHSRPGRRRRRRIGKAASSEKEKWIDLGVILFALTFSCAYELVFRHHLGGRAHRNP